MIKIGEYNELKVARKSDFGLFLDAKTGNTSDDILLPIKDVKDKEVNIGDTLNVFIYRDSKDRPIATLRKPYAKVSDIAYLKVISNTKIGAFLDIGLERDLFVPIKEQGYILEPNKSYLFYVYVDKTGRLAGTTNIGNYLEPADDTMVNKEVTGIVYGFQTNGSAMVAIENKYDGVILKNEYFNRLYPGEKLNLRVKKLFEDGRLSLTPRKSPKNERLELEDKIYEYLKAHGGSMPYNDKSSPEDIKRTFHESKNYFKNALGGLMKKGLIIQNENGTKLK
ncbi:MULTISPECIES: CvfB family protein [Clostridium]|uniref:CvfB family protein n=1 Tax=Clostridium TaxID=1485 RepID=UPI00069D6046|nr:MULTISPECIES: S1-like domain-containing RNA-binding protein [Clostridium]KOF56415.1 DNA-binding protein [Clostridium sp. DMHC 10]MCD2345834.1 S1-like domain-containing RNA-binding protein [Clostridium guangxiense]